MFITCLILFQNFYKHFRQVDKDGKKVVEMEKNHWQDHIVAYSQLQHFKFEEGLLLEALEELRQPWRGT